MKRTMEQALYTRAILINFFKKYETVIIFILKFLFGLYLFRFINGIGYAREEFLFLFEGSMAMPYLILMAFLFAMLRMTPCYGIIILNITIQLSSNTEIAIIVFMFLLCVLFFYIRMSARESILILFTLLAFYFKVPYLTPLFSGLYFGLTSVIPIMIGVFVWSFIPVVMGLMKTAETAGLNIMEMPVTMAAVLGELFAGLSTDYSWVYISFIFAMAVLVVFFVSRFSLDYSKDIAVGMGALIVIFGYIIGTAIIDLPFSIFTVVFFVFVSLLLVEIMRFFDIVLDYKHVQRVEFSDEDNYYYVKVIPKIVAPRVVAAPAKKRVVKKRKKK